MNNSEAKIHLSLKDGVFELSGSEQFVSEQIENFKDIILETLQKRQNLDEKELFEIDDQSPTAEEPLASGDKSEQCIFNKTFPRVLHIENTDVKIIKKMNGKNYSQKTVNTALAYLWGKKSVGIENVSFKEIRDLCQHQSCLDTNNFSAHMKSAREYIVIGGKKNSSMQTCKLTLPGMEKAEELLEELNGE